MYCITLSISKNVGLVYRWHAWVIKVRESLYTLVMSCVDSNLNHIDTTMILTRYEVLA